MRTEIALSLFLATSMAYAEPEHNSDHGHAVAAAPAPRPHERFTDAERVFREAKAMLLKDDVDDGLTEEDLYRGAVAGMLAASGRKWDALLSPSELSDMESTLAGNIVGIGIELDVPEPAHDGAEPNEGGKAFPAVLGVFAGSPADRAGVLVGDRIMRIDGHSVHGPAGDEITRRIRGKADTSVELTLLRDDQMLTKKIMRKPVVVSAVSDVALPEGTALVWIRSFNDKTPGLLRASLTRIAATHPRGLVLDLRDNQGGLLDKMIDCAGQLLPKGALIATEVHRGKREEQLRTSTDPLLRVPIAVLTNGSTASGAEILAGALREDVGARLVGARTHGKWNVQQVSDLPNGYAMKFTIGVFRTPKGQSPDGKGIDPDVPVDLADEAISRSQRIGDATRRLAADAQLRAALALLK